MIQYLYLGRVPYDEALRLQDELVALRLPGPHRQRPAPPRAPSRTHPRPQRQPLQYPGLRRTPRRPRRHPPRDQPRRRRHLPRPRPAHRLPHLRPPQPPQPSSGSRLGPVDFVRLMEEALIRLCAVFGVPAGRICGLTGVWCGLPRQSGQTRSKDMPPPRRRKIAAIGIHVSRGITSHGFAFNLTTDLRDFALINPCGITDRPVTSLKNEIQAAQHAAALRPAPHSRSPRPPGRPPVRPGLRPADSRRRKPRRPPRPGRRRERPKQRIARFSRTRHAPPGSSRGRASHAHQQWPHRKTAPFRA